MKRSVATPSPRDCCNYRFYKLFHKIFESDIHSKVDSCRSEITRLDIDFFLDSSQLNSPEEKTLYCLGE